METLEPHYISILQAERLPSYNLENHCLQLSQMAAHLGAGNEI